LAAALRNQCREFQKIYNEISIAVDFAVFENEVPKTIRILIYRVFQEAMNNIAKHSAARKVRVALKKKSGCVVLVIEDDGRGFHTDRPADAIGSSKGLGIDSMRERSELFGGDFSLQSRIGKGTRIEVSWPLHT
jgi:signal transduction histidine kinase